MRNVKVEDMWGFTQVIDRVQSVFLGKLHVWTRYEKLKAKRSWGGGGGE